MAVELRQYTRRPTQEVRRRVHVTAGRRPPPSIRQAPRSVGTNRAPAVIDGAEIGEVEVRLLEVKAQDLLELELAATRLVDAVGPLHESLMQVRARSLQEPLVRGIAD